eukprot:TRINITY_DN5536_c0_g1_i1.p1 TRINITY_DN5536_c0_g1~~TRINITY_DN5536_c0_g1_i1.p1  ORF type:complete len:476 (+),score=147.88 TRINITY_DN5536_c0_g1_i1:136-1563(+)
MSAGGVRSTVRVPSTLANFLVYTPKDTKEGMEHQQILYYWNPSDPIETQSKLLGLSQAFINFTSKFSPNQPCEVAHYEKHTSVFLEPEPTYWIVMRCTVPTSTKHKDGKEVIEYRDYELDDAALKSTQKRIYQIFKMFNGSFLSIIKSGGEESLKAKLAEWIPRIISSIKFDRMNLFTTFEGVHFLPVDRNVYLGVQTFVQSVENTFPCIKQTFFLQEDHLVWSGLEQEDMRVVYSFLCSQVIPALRSESNNQSSLSSSDPLPTARLVHSQSFGKDQTSLLYTSLSGYSLTKGNETIKALPLFYLGKNDEPCALMIYQLGKITCSFIVGVGPNDDPIDVTLCNNLASYITNKLPFAHVLEEHFNRRQLLEEQYRYVYFNHINLALKTSFKDKGSAIPKEIMTLLNQIHADFEKSTEGVSEVLIRTHNDKWIVGRKSDQREFFVIFDETNKSSHLMDISDEVKKLSATYFNNIFID